MLGHNWREVKKPYVHQTTVAGVVHKRSVIYWSKICTFFMEQYHCLKPTIH